MTTTRTDIVRFDDPEACERSVVGTKASHLAELRAAGFPVPDGLVLPATLLAGWRAGAAPPAEVERAIEEVVASFEGAALAVRSSADAEDGTSASFAGTYATLLGATGVEEVTAAVRTCLDSADAPRLDAYRGAGGVRMSVLCQPMLDPAAAGVAFTADPVSGDTDVARISAVRGLGDRVVDRGANPDEWRVVGEVAETIPTGAEVAISVDQAVAVAEVARAAADHFGSPQDVEWAIHDGRVHLLQSRPISALPVHPAAQLEGLGWEKDVAHYPELVTPFGWSLFEPASDAAVRAMSSDFGLMLAGLDQVSIGGEIYIRPVPPFGSPEPQGSAPPAVAVGLVARLVPALRTRMKAAKRALTSGLPAQRLATWDERWRGEFEQRTQTLLAEDLVCLDDAGLIDHLERGRTLLGDGHYVHFQLLMPYTLALHELVQLCGRLLGWDETDTLRLLVGSSPASVAGARSLDALRDRVASRPELVDALRDAAADPVAALRSVDPDVADELDAWLNAHAWRPTNYDPGSPAVIERPGVVTRLLLHDDASKGSDVAARAEAAALAQLAEADRVRFVAVLEQARRVYPVREENVVLTDNVPCGILRRWVLEAGRRLVGRGLLARVDDAVFCTADELVDAVRGGSEGLDLLVAQRRGEQAWTRAHPGPAVVGVLDELPDLRFLPSHGRRMNEAMLWGLKMEFPGEMARTDGEALRGSPASPGSYTGRVRVVRGEADFGTVLPGEVLVCPTAAPSWTVLFAITGALVTDGGGPLAHAAIVAREHGLPAVVGTVYATNRLTDGQLVTVDGTTGTVTVHPVD
jgi:rifampicin phosphotransferase